jgi:hypothetical protein
MKGVAPNPSGAKSNDVAKIQPLVGRTYYCGNQASERFPVQRPSNLQGQRRIERYQDVIKRTCGQHELKLPNESQLPGEGRLHAELMLGKPLSSGPGVSRNSNH